MDLLSPQTTNACSRGKYGYNVKLVVHIYQIRPNVLCVPCTSVGTCVRLSVKCKGTASMNRRKLTKISRRNR